MIRKFKINNYLKGQMYRVGCEKAFTYEKLTQQSQIMSIDYSMLDHEQIKYFESIMGLTQTAPVVAEAREILEGDIDGYMRVDKKYISSQTEKAIRINDAWFPKSQIIEKEKYIYIKAWIFEKNICTM